MPTVDGSRSLLTAGANYNAGDWASVGAEASVDLLAVAQLNRGVDLGLGVEALASLDGSIRKYLAADVNGEAHAAARVRAQVQMPLDLFDEAGLAVRLQAVAEASAGVQLAIGLSVGDFLALAATDPRMRGAPLELLKIFLDEFAIEGGVMAKASAAAMAYANIAATGSLIKRGSRKPGFTVVAEAGVGLKAGAGFRVFARFGVDDPRRLIRRTIDVAVSETLASVAALAHAAAAQLLREAQVPLKIAFRSTFEIGAALADGSVSGASNQGKLALRAVQVALEEMQRHVLQAAVEYASDQLKEAFASLAFDNAVWTTSRPQRQALSARLRAAPAEPFEATDANRAYWTGVIADAANVAIALQPQADRSILVAEPLAILWCGAQLLMKSVERISVAQARASVINAPAVGTTAAFSGPLPTSPAPVREHINSRLGHAASLEIGQKDAIDFLLKVIGYRLELIAPGLHTIIPMLTGKGDLAQALSTVFSNLGAFTPRPDGTIDADASLAVIQQGLSDYIAGRLDSELVPLIGRLAQDQPEIRTYFDEVLIATLKTVVDTVFTSIRTSQPAAGGLERPLREMCSSLLMRLLGRSLVVVTDVLSDYALQRLQGELRRVGDHANDPGGVVPVLAGLTGLDRSLVNDLVVETMDVCAATFARLPPERRAHVRDLLYQMIDTMPPDAGASTLQSLKSAGMIGNAEAALELAQLLGEDIANRLILFIQGALTRVAAALLALLNDAIADVQRSIDAWLSNLQQLVASLFEGLANLQHEIAQLELDIDHAADDLFSSLSRVLGGFATQGGSRAAVRARVKDAFATRAIDAVATIPGYGALPSNIRHDIRQTIRNVVNGVLDGDVFDTVVDVLANVAGETATLLVDLREIEPGDDLAVAVANLALDRIEAALRRAFQGNPRIRVAFNAPVIGSVDLGRITIPMGDFVRAIRGAIRALDTFDAAVEAAATGLAGLFDLEADHEAATHERDVKRALKDEADSLVAESGTSAVDLRIIAPDPSAALNAPFVLKLSLSGVGAACLGSSGLSHQRLFVWVNGAELDLINARVAASVAPIRPLPSPALPSLVVPSRALQPAAPAGARLQRRDLEASETRARRAQATQHEFQPVSRPTASGSLGVEIDVPAGSLHEGINAIVAVLLPGASQRRIERTLSFLIVTDAATSSGPHLRPARPAPLDLHGDILDVLRARGVPTITAPAKRIAVRTLPGGSWSMGTQAQRERIASGRKAMNERLGTAVTRVAELKAKSRERRLRPARDRLAGSDRNARGGSPQ